jgi:hypothetical protein
VQKPLWSGRRLISLWEIVNDFRAVQFWWLSHELLRLEMELSEPADEVGGRVVWIADLKGRMTYVWNQCESIGLNPTDISMVPYCNISAELQRIEVSLGRRIDVASIKREIKALRKNIELELDKRKFIFVSEENAKYFEQDKLFGNAVYEKFEKAREDIKDAGTCLAIGLPTACIFHLTRASEIALRHIAKKVGVTLKDKGKPQPLEYATWDKVITKIQSHITQAKLLPQGPRKARRLSFFSDAADQCSYIKELWRNEVSHTRKRYNENEALGAMQRIKNFMELLTGEPQ